MVKIKPRILIAGVGNELRRDDGFGPAVIEDLLRRGDFSEALSEADVLNFGQRLYDLLLKMRDYDVVIIVDAVEGDGEPGDIYVIKPEDVLEGTKNLNPHTADLKELIALAEELGQLPERVYVVGCHPEDVSWGTGLTPALAKKVPVVIDLIQEIIKNYV